MIISWFVRIIYCILEEGAEVLVIKHGVQEDPSKEKKNYKEN